MSGSSSKTATQTAVTTPERAEDELLDVTDLSIAFPGSAGDPVYPVHGLQFTMSRGQRLALVGESGSGKSLTGLAIMRLVRPPGRIAAGTIVFRGQSLLDLPAAEMTAVRGAEIAMIYQDPTTALNPIMSIGNQVVEALRAHRDISRKAARARAVDMLKEVGLRDAAGRFGDYPHQFSGGMRQRVMIAIALVAEPAVLIADECTTALDVTMQALIVARLREIVDERGTAVLFITHNLDLASDFCSDIHVMYAGRIVESGPVAELRAAPLHPYSGGLLRSVCRIDSAIGQRLAVIKGQPPAASGNWTSCAFAMRCPHVFDECLIREPALTSVARATDRRVACHLPSARAGDPVV